MSNQQRESSSPQAVQLDPIALNNLVEALVVIIVHAMAARKRELTDEFEKQLSNAVEQRMASGHQTICAILPPIVPDADQNSPKEVQDEEETPKSE